MSLWMPSQVVSSHRKRATALWVALFATLLAYAGYLMYQAVEDSKNPSTSFVLSNSVYRYPDVYVCLYNFFGCDEAELEEDCLASVDATEGGKTSATFNPNEDDELQLSTHSSLTEHGYCLAFNVSDVPVTSEERDAEDYVLINMYWYPGGRANNSTSCIEEDGAWESHSESVFVFLRDSATGIFSAGIQVAYSCQTSASSSHVFTYMGIGLTKEDKLKTEDTALYSAVATSSAIYKDKRDGNITGIESPYAWLSMEVAQTTDSLVIITEIDPLKIAEMFGNIGGFYDLLLLLWPVFFIAATREEPQLKARNFRKCVTRGVEQARRTTMIIAEARPRRQGQENFTVCCNQAVSKSEERAAWEATSGYTRHRNTFSSRRHSRRRAEESRALGNTLYVGNALPAVPSDCNRHLPGRVGTTAPRPQSGKGSRPLPPAYADNDRGNTQTFVDSV